MRHESRADEGSRSRDHSAVVHLDAGQPVLLDREPGNTPFNDPDGTRDQLLAKLGREHVVVREQDNIGDHCRISWAC